MPRFIDMHTGFHGVSPEALAEGHVKAVAEAGKYGVKYVKYWYDATTGRVFCLSEAPSKEAMIAAHGDSGGLRPDDIFEVEEYE